MKYVSEDPPLWPRGGGRGRVGSGGVKWNISGIPPDAQEHEICFRFLPFPLVHSSTGYTDKLKASILPFGIVINLAMRAAINPSFFYPFKWIHDFF